MKTRIKTMMLPGLMETLNMKKTYLILASIFLLIINGFSQNTVSIPYYESFENGLGDWLQASNDDTDWLNQTGQTPTSSTGPFNASDGQYYMYIDASYPNNPNKTAVLISPSIDLGPLPSELSFQYNMFGSDIGTLSLDVSTNNGATWNNIWTKAGNQSYYWHTATIDLSAFANLVVELRFSGSTTNSDKGDIAIDKFQVQVNSNQITAIPDPNFEQALINLGYDNILDGSVITANINTVTFLDVDSKGISDLTGIEDFTSIFQINCNYNSLNFIDVSNNTALTELNCWGNQLTSLDVSNNTALTTLECNGNDLTSLDVSQNIALTKLSCKWNNLVSLDVSQNIALTVLQCDLNQLFALDVSQNIALTELTCGWNNLTSINVGQNTALTWLWCTTNQLTSLDVSGATALTSLYCSRNNLTSLNMSQNTALRVFYCDDNNLTSLDMSQNTALATLYCENNNLTSINVSQNTALTGLRCMNNQLFSLDISQTTALIYLNCGDNQLTSLDVSQNTALQSFHCDGNNLTSLDISQNIALDNLKCSDNQLTSLDVSQNTDLYVLYCAKNNLNSLDVSQNTDLTVLKCYDNQLSYLNLRNGNNNNLFFTFKAFQNPNLTCIEVDDAAWSTANWSSIDPQATFSEDCSAYCFSESVISSWFYIDNITLGGINNASGIDGGYGNYTHLSSTLSDGMQISLTPGFAFGPTGMFWNVWIDFNQDGDFDDNGELACHPLPGSGTLYESINIPAGAIAGPTRMRIQAQAGYWASGPCETFLYGEVEDYTVHIVVGSNKMMAGDEDGPTIDAQKEEGVGTTMVMQGSEELELLVKAYPNPSDGIVDLIVEKGSANGFSYQVYDLTGQLIEERNDLFQEKTTIDLTGLSSGIYTIKVRSKEMIKTQKLIIK